MTILVPVVVLAYFAIAVFVGKVVAHGQRLPAGHPFLAGSQSDD